MALICWSGGCDSTLILYQQIKKLKPCERLHLFSINHYQVGAQLELKRARQGILEMLDRQGIGYNYIEMAIHATQDVCQVGLGQPQIWINAISYLEHDEDLLMGYIKGDMIWHYRSDLVLAFGNLRDIQAKSGNILFPLEWETKADVIRELKKVGWYDYCWYCENPTLGKACGICDPCKTHALALMEIERFDPKPELESLDLATKTCNPIKTAQKDADKYESKVDPEYCKSKSLDLAAGAGVRL